MIFVFRSFKRFHNFMINIDVFAKTINSFHSFRTSILNSLTKFNVNTIFSNDTYDLKISAFYVQKSNENEYNNESNWAKFLTNDRHDFSTKIFLISNDTNFENITSKQIVIRFHEMFDIKEKEKQIEIIHVVDCFKKTLILIAKISFDKSLIFNILFLLHFRNTNIVLMIIFLKFIAKQ